MPYLCTAPLWSRSQSQGSSVSLFPAMMQCVCMHFQYTCCGAGVWATLQFKWIQLRYPVVCTALERLLFAGTLPVAAMILTWATLIAVGPSIAPFYQAVLLSGLLLQSELKTP